MIKLKWFLYDIASKFLFYFGFYPVRVSGREQIISLIKKLSPINTGNKLIRLGQKGDGGYLVPDDLAGIDACFSPGVAVCSDFENDCAERGMKVFLADKSVEAPALSHKNFNFIKKFIGTVSDDDTITMDDWLSSSLTGDEKDLLLQMDIEGAEYEAILNISDEYLNKFRIIVIEFHYLDQLWNKPQYLSIAGTFERILKSHACLHIHPNNCCGTATVGGIEIPKVAEFTFLRRDRFEEYTYADVFPHPLDSDNTDHPSIDLPLLWFKSGSKENRNKKFGNKH